MKPSPLAGVDLHDIMAAPPPPFWPPAPGWWLLAILLAGILLFAGWRLLRAWQRRRRRQQILGELDRLAEASPQQVVQQVSVLLRRVALLCHEHHRVAALSGTSWLEFLDRTGGNGAFCNGAGQALGTAPYRPARTAADIDIPALVALARSWINMQLRTPA